MVDRRTLGKNARRLKLGRCYAYLDILIISIFYFVEYLYIICPFVDAYSVRGTFRSTSQGMKYDWDIVTYFVGWVTWILFIFTLRRYISGNRSLSKKQLKTDDLILFLISVVLLIVTIAISPFLENTILWKLGDAHTHRLMMRLYQDCSLFMVYTFIRWLLNFNYHEYYHYSKGETYNRKFFLYLFLSVGGLATFYDICLTLLTRYFFG